MKIKRTVVLPALAFFTAANILLGFATAAAGNASQPAQATSVTLGEDDTVSFTRAFESIALQAHVAIVAEGEPLHAAISRDAARKIQITNNSPRVAVEKMAEAFDYDVSYEGGIYQLTKRYTSPSDLPEVPLAEWQQSVQDMVKILDWYSPHLKSVPQGSGKQEPVAAYLMSTLTPEQLRKMKSENGGLPVASLTPEQRDAVWQAALWFHLQLPEDDLKITVKELGRIARPGAVFGYYQEPSPLVRYFGVYYPALPSAAQPTVRIVPRYFISLDSSVAGRAIGRYMSIDTEPMQEEEKPDASDDPVPLQRDTTPAQHYQTLEMLASSLRTRSAGAETSVALEVDPALVLKSVSVFGATWANPQDVFVGAGRIYGLRIDAKAAETGVAGKSIKTLTLTRNSVRNRPKRAQDVADEIRRAFPVPFLRATHQVKFLKYNQNVTAKSADKAAQESSINAAENRNDMSQIGGRLTKAALHRMRIQLSAKLKDTKEVPITEADRKSQMALSVYSLASVLESMKSLLYRDPPQYITEFPSALIVGGVYTNPEGKQKFSLNLAVPNPTQPNGIWSPVGVSELDYIK